MTFISGIVVGFIGAFALSAIAAAALSIVGEDEVVPQVPDKFEPSKDEHEGAFI
jgi:hypothetical protein